MIPNIINYTEPIIVCDLHIKSASTYLCVNVARVEAVDVIWKRAGDNPALPVLITLSSGRISCAYSLPNSPKYPADGIQLQIEEVTRIYQSLLAVSICHVNGSTKDDSSPILWLFYLYL